MQRSRKKALKEYDPLKDMSGEKFNQIQNDKNNKGGVDNTRTDEGTDKGTDTIAVNPIRPEQPKGRELLPKTAISDAGKDSPIPGTNSSTVRRRLFGRRHTKK